MVASIVVLLLLALSAGFLFWRRNMKSSAAKYQPSDPVVITFSNPNYYSEGPSTGSASEGNPGNTGCVPDKEDDVEAVHVASDKYPILWRRLKYDKTMVSSQVNVQSLWYFQSSGRPGCMTDNTSK